MSLETAVTVVQLGLAVLITIVWCAVFVNAYVLDPTGPKPPAEFSAPMLAIATALYGSVIRKTIKNGNGKG